jgi:hypothetical protein
MSQAQSEHDGPPPPEREKGVQLCPPPFRSFCSKIFALIELRTFVFVLSASLSASSFFRSFRRCLSSFISSGDRTGACANTDTGASFLIDSEGIEAIDASFLIDSEGIEAIDASFLIDSEGIGAIDASFLIDSEGIEAIDASFLIDSEGIGAIGAWFLIAA